MTFWGLQYPILFLPIITYSLLGVYEECGFFKGHIVDKRWICNFSLVSAMIFAINNIVMANLSVTMKHFRNLPLEIQQLWVDLHSVPLSHFLLFLIIEKTNYIDIGKTNVTTDDSQVQKINCSTCRLEKVVEPTRSWRYWLARMINKTITVASVFGVFGCIIARE